MTTNPNERAAELDEQEFGRAALERVTLYRWLGRVFQRECDVGVLVWHRSDQGRAFLDMLASHPPFSKGARQIADAVCSDRPIDDEVIRFAGGFSALFYGIDPLRSAPPYESHYTEESGRLFGEATVRMQELLARYGLTLMGFSEPSDHIAVHLQMMAYFSELMGGHDPKSLAAAELMAAQLEFLNTHLNGWVNDFAGDCIRFDRTGLYAGAAEILLAFLDEERARLQADYETAHVIT